MRTHTHTHTMSNDDHAFIYGIAYNVALKERRTTRCSAPHDSDPEVFYMDEAIRWTQDELRNINLRGKPICIEHDPGKRAGTILEHWVDERGDFRLVARIDASTREGRAIVEAIDSGRMRGLSVGYINQMDPRTGRVTAKEFEEISLCETPHFSGCGVAVRASKKSPYKYSQIPWVAVHASTMSSNNEDSSSMEIDGQQQQQHDHKELVRQVGTKAAELQATKEELEHARKELARFRAAEEQRKAQEEKLRQEYAERQRQVLPEIQAYYKENYEADGKPMPEEFAKEIEQMALDPQGAHHTKVAVMASKRSKDYKQQIADLQAKVNELQGVIEASRAAMSDQQDVERAVKASKHFSGESASASSSSQGLDDIMEQRPAYQKWHRFLQVDPYQLEQFYQPEPATATIAMPVHAHATTTTTAPTAPTPMQQQQQQPRKREREEPPSIRTMQPELWNFLSAQTDPGLECTIPSKILQKYSKTPVAK